MIIDELMKNVFIRSWGSVVVLCYSGRALFCDQYPTLAILACGVQFLFPAAMYDSPVPETIYFVDQLGTYVVRYVLFKYL